MRPNTEIFPCLPCISTISRRAINTYPQSTIRIGRDGRTINTAKIGRRKRRQEEDEDLQAEDLQLEDEPEDEHAEDEEEGEFVETEELDELEEFDAKKEGRNLKKWLREKLELWPEKYRPKAVCLIRQVLETSYNL